MEYLQMFFGFIGNCFKVIYLAIVAVVFLLFGVFMLFRLLFEVTWTFGTAVFILCRGYFFLVVDGVKGYIKLCKDVWNGTEQNPEE